MLSRYVAEQSYAARKGFEYGLSPRKSTDFCPEIAAVYVPHKDPRHPDYRPIPDPKNDANFIPEDKPITKITTLSLQYQLLPPKPSEEVIIALPDRPQVTPSIQFESGLITEGTMKEEGITEATVPSASTHMEEQVRMESGSQTAELDTSEAVSQTREDIIGKSADATTPESFDPRKKAEDQTQTISINCTRHQYCIRELKDTAIRCRVGTLYKSWGLSSDDAYTDVVTGFQRVGSPQKRHAMALGQRRTSAKIEISVWGMMHTRVLLSVDENPVAVECVADDQVMKTIKDLLWILYNNGDALDTVLVSSEQSAVGKYYSVSLTVKELLQELTNAWGANFTHSPRKCVKARGFIPRNQMNKAKCKHS